MTEAVRERRGLLALALLAAASAVLAAMLLAPFVKPLLFAAVLAVAFEPLYERLLRLLRSTALAALAATLVIVLLVLAPLGMIAVTVIQEAGVVYQAAAHYTAQQGGWAAWLAKTVEQPVQWMAQKTGLPAPDVKAALLDQAQALVKLLGGWGASLLSNITLSLANALLALFILFFLFLEGPKIRDGLYEWSPLPREKTAVLLGSIRDSIIANFHGIAAVALVQGALTSLGFLFTGLGAPVFWGVAAAICSLIPVVGTAIIWLPGALFLLLQGAWGKALFLALWGAVVVGMSDNVVRPWVLSGRTGMNGLLVFFALMGGMQVFGAIGIFAGPVIFSTAAAVFRMLREEYAPQAEVTSSAEPAAGPGGPASPPA
ncbi:MAG: AI-2E family transporter [Bryobacteraceae bacterium]|nr:AI-2E family transporter [Bryobacteraceae bacterium]